MKKIYNSNEPMSYNKIMESISNSKIQITPKMGEYLKFVMNKSKYKGLPFTVINNIKLLQAVEDMMNKAIKMAEEEEKEIELMKKGEEQEKLEEDERKRKELNRLSIISKEEIKNKLSNLLGNRLQALGIPRNQVEKALFGSFGKNDSFTVKDLQKMFQRLFN